MDIKQAIENVHAISGGTPALGTLKLTSYHIVFSTPIPLPNDSAPSNGPPKYRESWITYPIISSCTLRPTAPASAIPSSIRLRCRDFNFVTFNFPDDKSAREAFDFIRTRTCRLGSIEKLYAFYYNPARQERGLNGWDLYDARAEFRRQGISEKSADLGWRISTMNRDYNFSPTYPALLVVPTRISDSTLKHAGKHRSRARIPTLTYLHPINNCTITRSSQPFVGIRGNRSIQDESLVSACFSASSDLQGPSTAPATLESSPTSSQTDLPSQSSDPELSDTERLEDELISGSSALYDEKTGKRLIYGAQQHNLIVDARPAINSYAMQAIGMGSENMDYYRFAKKVFLSIDNIHVMRESLNKVIEAVKDADVSPFPPNRDLLAKSGWLKHITGILDGSAIIARQVGIQHSHVLIHCSDGWDRTSQLSAMAQLMLDPYYRTIDGFIVLVEKDWLSFGHMFQQRSGFLNYEKWFTVQSDGLAGSKIEPGEVEGRGDAIESAMASAKRFFKKNLGQDRGDSDAEDLGAEEDIAKPATATALANQATRPKEISPVFHQFLDATYQLLRQHPTRFEFNERFLRRLLYHLYSCQYGTFLYNNERQRQDSHVKERTSSVWNYFLCRRPEFTNPEYDATVDDHTKGQERLLFPRLGEVRWWHQLFNRTDDEMNGQLNALAAAAERVANYHSVSINPAPLSPQPGESAANSRPATPLSHSASSKPLPGLPNNNSVLTGVETAHEALTPGPSPVSFNRSVSASTAEMPGAFAAIRDGIAGLNIGKGYLSGLGQSHTTSGNSVQVTGGGGDEEMREMS